MKRVLLKLSGEALAGDKHMGFDEPTVTKVAKQVKEIAELGGILRDSQLTAEEAKKILQDYVAGNTKQTA